MATFQWPIPISYLINCLVKRCRWLAASRLDFYTFVVARVLYISHGGIFSTAAFFMRHWCPQSVGHFQEEAIARSYQRNRSRGYLKYPPLISRRQNVYCRIHKRHKDDTRKFPTFFFYILDFKVKNRNVIFKMKVSLRVWCIQWR